MTESTMEMVRRILRVSIPSVLLETFRMARWRTSAYSPSVSLANWDSFKLLASHQVKKGADEYGRFLCRADPSLSLPVLSSPQFFGEGWGDWNLNVYRMGELDGCPVFEKVYLSGSEPLQKSEWFNSIVLPQVGASFVAPPILYRARGQLLTVLYFPFMQIGEPASVDLLLQTALDIKAAGRGFHICTLDPVIRDFRRDFFYSTHRKALISFLLKNSINIDSVFQIERWLQRSEMLHLFSHGDLSPDNVRACGTILDFDHCGLYPSGYDCGAILRYLQYSVTVPELESFVKTTIAPEDLDTHFAILFFTAVFSSIGVNAKTSKSMDEQFLLNLWNLIIEYFHLKEVKTY